MRLIIKQIFVFLFLFAILEKAEVSVVSVILSDNSINKNVLLDDAENTSNKESETKEQSSKDYWNCSFCYNIAEPMVDYSEDLHIRNDQFSHSLFYPSVPTPPPDQA